MIEAAALSPALSALISNLATGALLAAPVFVLSFVILRAGMVDLMMGARGVWSVYLLPAAALIGLAARLALDFEPPVAAWTLRALVIAAPPALISLVACRPFASVLKRAEEGDQDAGALSAGAALAYSGAIPAFVTISNL